MVRIKHRYLLVNILYPHGSDAAKAPKDKQNVAPDTVKFHQPTSDQLTSPLILSMIRRAVVDLFGDYGAGMIASSLRVMYFSPATSTIIIRIARPHYRLVWAALTYTTYLPPPVNEPCVFHVIRVSGTVRKAEEEAIRRAREDMRRAKREAGGVKEIDMNVGALASKADSGLEGARGTGREDDVKGIEDEDVDMDDAEDDEKSDG